MEHRYYPKINETLSATALTSSLWVATEKIHGAQFVIATDGEDIKFGKRKAWLQNDDPFFGWQLLRNSLSESVLKVFSLIDNAHAIYLYGEIFGGNYPHNEVKNIASLSPVQTGIWYSPDIHFALFDILIMDTNSEEGTFLAFTEVGKIATAANLFLVPKLGIGSFNKMMQLPLRFESRVSSKLNLPIISDNYAEGFVLKPDIKMTANKRAIVKVKIPEFKENRFDESRSFNPKAMPDLDELTAFSEMMINSARIASAKSKVGEDKATVIEEAVLDVIVDLESILPLRMQSLSNSDEDQLVMFIRKKLMSCY